MAIKFLPVVNAPDDIILPKRSKRNDAGYDFFAPHDFEVAPGERTPIIWTKVKVILPDRLWLDMKNRSSMVEKGLLLECSGVIDAGYANNPKNDGDIGVAFRNVTDKCIFIEKGDKICQGIISCYFVTDDDAADGERVGGFGSTGR